MAAFFGLEVNLDGETFLVLEGYAWRNDGLNPLVYLGFGKQISDSL